MGIFGCRTSSLVTFPYPREDYSRVERTEVVVSGTVVPFSGLGSSS